MNVTLDFVRTLIWPVVVLVVLISSRRQIPKLITRLSKLDAPGVSITFDAATEQAVAVTRSEHNERPVKHLDIDATQRIRPRTYLEARRIGELYRSGSPVLLDLTELTDADAKRLVDFSAGIAFQAYGAVDKITTKVFYISQPRSPERI